MKWKGIWICVVLATVVIEITEAAPQCTNLLGNTVPWWFILKESRSGANGRTGAGYWYYEGNWDPAVNSEWVRSPVRIDDVTSHLARTVLQVEVPNALYGFFNDQTNNGNRRPGLDAWQYTPAENANAYNAHAKGFFAFDQNTFQGFYVMHSLPRFPTFPTVPAAPINRADQNFWTRPAAGNPAWFPPSGYAVAQHFFCYAIPDQPTLNVVANFLAWNGVFVYRSNLINVLNADPALTTWNTANVAVINACKPTRVFGVTLQQDCRDELINQNAINAASIAECVLTNAAQIMVNGVAQPITFYAKTNVNFAALPVGAVAANINLEIWKDIISPIVGAPAPLLAQTFETATDEFPRTLDTVHDIKRMVYPDAGFLYEFDANNNDIIRRSHSKLAVSSDITDNTFCMGDVNRRISGDRTRGGGVICFVHPVLSQVFRRMSNEINRWNAGLNVIEQLVVTVSYPIDSELTVGGAPLGTTLGAVQVEIQQGGSLYPPLYIDVERDGTFEYDFRQWGTIFAAPIPNAIARLDNSRNDLKRLKGVDNADAVLVYPLTRVGADYETPAANQDAIQTYMMFYYQHFLQDVSYQSDEDLTIFIGPAGTARQLNGVAGHRTAQTDDGIWNCEFAVYQLYDRFVFDSSCSGFYAPNYDNNLITVLTQPMALYQGVALGYTTYHFVQDSGAIPSVPSCALSTGLDVDLELYGTPVIGGVDGSTVVGWVAASVYDLLDTNPDSNGGNINNGAMGYQDNNQAFPVTTVNMKDAITNYQATTPGAGTIVTFYANNLNPQLSANQKAVLQGMNDITIYDKVKAAGVAPPSCFVLDVDAYPAGSIQYALNQAGICPNIIDDLSADQLDNISSVLLTWTNGNDWDSNSGIYNILYQPNINNQTQLMKALQTMSMDPQASVASCGIPQSDGMWSICDPLAIVWATSGLDQLVNYATEAIEYGAGLNTFYHPLPYYFNTPGMGVFIATYGEFYCTAGIIPETSFAQTGPSFLCDVGPIVTSISPASGPAVGGTSVTIYGFNFGTSTVFIGNETCTNTYIASNGTIMIVTTPPGTGAHLEVLVELNGKYSQANTTFFSYDAPIITGISPDSGTTQGGTSVTITGVNFGASSGNNSLWNVTIGGQPCDSVTWEDDSTIVCVTPPGSGTNKVVSVLVNGQASVSSAAFSYFAPNVTGVDPSLGPAAGGIWLTITGSEFGPADSSETWITIGGEFCTNITWVSYESLLCLCPSGTGLNNVIQVSVDYQQTNTSVDPVYFDYEGPTIYSVEPNLIPTIGGEVVMFGINFGDSAYAVTDLLIGGTSAIGVSIGDYNDSTIVLTVDSYVGVGYNISISVENQFAYLADAISYIAPNITDVIFNETQTPAGGNNVTIVGNNFVPDLMTPPSAYFPGLYTAVVFNDVESGEVECLNVQWLSDQIISCTTPPGIFNNVTVWIGSQPSNAWPLIFNAPFVESINPPNGTTDGGTVVTVTGQNFITPNEDFYLVTSTQENNVTVGGILFWQVTWINATIFEGVIPAGVGRDLPVVVGIAGQLSNNNVTFSYLPPEVTSVTPALCNTTGCSILVEGSNFGNSETNISITVGPLTCSDVVFVSSTQLNCTVPQYIGFDYVVQVAVFDQASSSNATFSFYAPSILQADYSEANTNGGSLVTISGVNFIPNGVNAGNWDNNVTISGALCTNPSWISETTVTCTSPPGQGINQPIVVSVGGQASEPAYIYNYDGPIVTAIDPTGGPGAGGASVTITGSNFGTGNPLPSAFIGGAECTSVQLPENTTIVCLTPSGTGTNNPVVVIVSGQQSNDDVTYSYNRPVITSLDPNSGPTVGGFDITITGQNFGNGTITPTVTLAGYNAAVQYISDSTLIITCPPGAGLGVEVLVTVDGQTNDPNDAFFNFDAPTISGISPSTGPIIGGTRVTITGTNFGPSDTVISATINDDACTGLTYISQTQVSCTTPSGSGANLPVVITVAQQRNIEDADIWSYNAPHIDSIAPAEGEKDDPQTVVLTGTDLGTITDFYEGNIQVSFGDAGNAVVTRVFGSQQVWCIVPISDEATEVEVTLTLSGQESNSVSYTYTEDDSSSDSDDDDDDDGDDTGDGGTIDGTAIGGGAAAGAAIAGAVAGAAATGAAALAGSAAAGAAGIAGAAAAAAAATAAVGHANTATTALAANGITGDSTTSSISTGTGTGGSTTTTTGASTTGGGNSNHTVGQGLDIIPVNCLYDGTLPNGTMQILTSFSPLPVAIPAGVPLNLDFAPLDSILHAIAGCLSVNVPPIPELATGCGMQNCDYTSWWWNSQKINSSCPLPANSCPETAPLPSFCGPDYYPTIFVSPDTPGYFEMIANISLAENYAVMYYNSLASATDQAKCPDGSQAKNLVCSSIFPRVFNNRALPLCRTVAVEFMECLNPASQLNSPSTYNGTCYEPGTCNYYDFLNAAQLLPEADCTDLNQPPIIIDGVTGAQTEGGVALILGYYYGANNETFVKASLGRHKVWTQWESNYSVAAAVPPGVGGPYSIYLAVGNTTSYPADFFYYAPYISALAPPGVPTSGGPITVIGVNFGPGSPAPEVFVNGSYVTSQYISDYLLLAQFTPGIGTSYNVSVSVGGQTSNDYNFSYAAPVISQLNDAESYIGSTITLVGLNFVPSGIEPFPGDTVTVGGVECSGIAWTSATTILCIVPDGNGTVDVVAVVGGQVSNAVQFTYITPFVYGIQPTECPALGCNVLVFGANFGLGTNVDVFVGPKRCANAFAINSEVISCTVRPYAGANLVVTVNVNGFPSALSNVTFSYEPPLITGIFPGQGSTAGGYPVVLYGINFGELSWVELNPTIANVDNSSIIGWNDGAVEFFMPAGTPGTISFSVEIGGQISNEVNFTYSDEQPPAVTVLNMIVQLSTTGPLNKGSFAVHIASTVSSHSTVLFDEIDSDPYGQTVNLNGTFTFEFSEVPSILARDMLRALYSIAPRFNCSVSTAHVVIPSNSTMLNGPPTIVTIDPPFPATSDSSSSSLHLTTHKVPIAVGTSLVVILVVASAVFLYQKRRMNV